MISIFPKKYHLFYTVKNLIIDKCGEINNTLHEVLQNVINAMVDTFNTFYNKKKRPRCWWQLFLMLGTK
jgi:hypothetical protein